MSLLTEQCLPVRTRAGERIKIAPEQLGDPDLVAFDAERADFNGGLAQFAIGLLQTTAPIESRSSWARHFNNPPGPEALRQWFAPVAAAFEYEGPGPRFMQDLTIDDPPSNGIGSLLIDSPGENAVKNNSDHFVKRGRVQGLCRHCAITALLTLQINAPSGGAGHRTGLRGGGPLTTLLGCQPPRALWHDLWLNVIERPEFLAGGGNADLSAPHFTFPWMDDIAAVQKDKGETAPLRVHPFQVFWAMPRRIRLDLDAGDAGDCDICGKSVDRLVQRYATRPYGMNYKGPWDHPLSPYYETKEGWLPLHPQPGGFGYRHWLAWVAGVDDDKQRQRPSRTVAHFFRHRTREAGSMLRLWAFGYDMDNAKARCWYEATLPLYHLGDCDPDDIKSLQSQVGEWLAAARMAVFLLRSAVKSAWFGGDARGDFSAVDTAFWSATEPAFYRQLHACIEAVRQGGELQRVETNETWLTLLTRTALHLFSDVFVGAGPVERQQPHRIAAAYRQLRNTLGGPKIRQSLGLPTGDAAKRGKTRKPSTGGSTQPSA